MLHLQVCILFKCNLNIIISLKMIFLICPKNDKRIISSILLRIITE